MSRSVWLVYCFFQCLLTRSFASTRSAAVTTPRNGIHLCRNGIEYSGLGCFNLEAPFTNTVWLPRSPSAIGLQFLLYTQANPVTPNILSAGNITSITASNFNARYPVKFLVHGFLQYADMDYLRNMTSALLNKAPMNVIVVSWGDGAAIPYARAVANTRVVGAATAQLIARLQQVTRITALQVHIIGHSLGAHIGGYAGALIPNLGRITGLDPAQPSFGGQDAAVRLDKTDARFVDIIHSDALRYSTVQGYGIIEPIGHIDFYPNGGHHQPGCHEDSSVLDFIGDVVHNGMTRYHYFVSLILGHNMSFTDGEVSLRLRGTMGRQLNWKRVKEGRFFGGDRVTSMLVGDSNIGEVNNVDVRFMYRGNHLPWRGTSLVLTKVEVDNVMKFPRKYFCHSSVILEDDLEVTLQSGTYTDSECA